MTTTKSEDITITSRTVALLAVVAFATGTFMLAGTASADQHGGDDAAVDMMEMEAEMEAEMMEDDAMMDDEAMMDEPVHDDALPADPAAEEAYDATGEAADEAYEATEDAGAEAAAPAAEGMTIEETGVEPDQGMNIGDTPAADVVADTPAAEANPMVDTLTSVADTAAGIETSLETGEMSAEQAQGMISDLQAIVDMIEASLSM